MADLPKWYSTGTVSIANGSPTLTGSGTAWNNIIRAGDVFRRAGLAVRVLSVDSDTSITLAENWPGTTLSGSAYEIAITYDGPEFQLRTRELLEGLAGAVVSVAEGDGIEVDDTDPNNPVVSAKSGVPIGAAVDYFGTSLPARFLWPYGQNVLRADHPDLFAVFGTTYGAGDGSTTFGMPDLRGRVTAGKDDMGGTSANRLTSPINGDNLGAAGGSQSHTLLTAEMPDHSHQAPFIAGASGTVVFAPATTRGATAPGPSTLGAGGGGAHNNVQPTFICNKIIYAGV